MAEKCTKTSSPVDRWMKPKPLAPLNRFTVPFSLTNCSFRLCADDFPFSMQKGQTVPVTTAVRNKNAAASSAHAPCAIARLSCDPCFYDSSTAVPRFNLNRLLSCENDWSSYSGTHKFGNKKSSAFRFPPLCCILRRWQLPPRASSNVSAAMLFRGHVFSPALKFRPSPSQLQRTGSSHSFRSSLL